MHDDEDVLFKCDYCSNYVGELDAYCTDDEEIICEDCINDYITDNGLGRD